ncbi:alanine racemase [Shimwellia blattae]|uniref:Alanine racemase family n=1 Tax=Shimwellia blattae (strain ATCC 29907 / DSM 4481 / JCM 1650 / NBRC 105725 / CDC 9005-74) TaxID=630626 RepID=I2B9Z2_SHIBC|nr:alanine racemase [Shimwellia blattae]AFJ47346.1 alanine racemase family [Shimwellia blattae DSM 4481 = NBRC 105725]GAB80460.1 hypothetical protein YhfX [Shimwellia blattae DSM 4481 = NBRC 105725]VDY64842.1 Alanine racemase, N-terminal domain [Shimwellia blattae]VEC22962.1 Alanine racemase, N-terminal domain [Shimwellia blattae]
MFLTALERQNPALIGAALSLLRQGKITPDSYVIDVDTVEYNAAALRDHARQHQLTPYVMSKQFGRNPWLTRRIIDQGYSGAVAVDFHEARTLAGGGVPVQHLGHLVQIPDNALGQALDYHPQVITVFSVEKARRINAVAGEKGIIQPLLLKIYQPGDVIYPGQQGGFLLSEVAQAARQIAALPHVRLAGVTHFPCLLATGQPGEYRPTANFTTLEQGAALLREAQHDLWQINAPSANCCSAMPLLAARGVTHIEPGHAFTGTVPANREGGEVEQVAMLYISEISHHVGENSYCYGGGFYRRGNAHQALVFHQSTPTRSALHPPDPDSIDYYLSLEGRFPPGTPVVMCFRTQIFVTRSDVALVSGIRRGAARLEGVYSSTGLPVR